MNLTELIHDVTDIGTRARAIADSHRKALREGREVEPEQARHEVHRIVTEMDNVLRRIRAAGTIAATSREAEREQLVLAQQKYLALLQSIGEVERLACSPSRR